MRIAGSTGGRKRDPASFAEHLIFPETDAARLPLEFLDRLPTVLPLALWFSAIFISFGFPGGECIRDRPDACLIGSGNGRIRGVF
jgi:hypothetical protein